MAGLSYQGRTPAAGTDVMTERVTTDILDTGTTHTFTLDRITALSAPYATISYVNTADNNYANPGDVDTADALNVPLSSKGVPNGVATLDAGSKVPLAQCPNLGLGTVKGPYGAASQITVNTSTTSQVLLGTIDLSTPVVNFKPWAFATAFLIQTTSSARGALEMRMGDTTQTTYASQTLISAGIGRSSYTDYQSVTAQPCGDTTGLSATSGFGGGTHWIISLWLTATGGSVTVNVSNIMTLSAYLLRTSL